MVDTEEGEGQPRLERQIYVVAHKVLACNITAQADYVAEIVRGNECHVNQ